MIKKILLVLGAIAAAALITMTAMIGGSQGAQGSTPPPLTCTRAYGMCQVTEYIHIRRDGTQWIETCFASAPVTEGHGGVRVAVVYCERP